MPFDDILERNMSALCENPYPGRGIVVGMNADEEHFVQIYWIMGRSENSRNRVFMEEGQEVRTRAHDEAKVEDPSLIIYNCARQLARTSVVSNGDHTDTIIGAMQAGRTFEDALYTRDPEPDPPHFTPRIAGVVNLGDPFHAYKLGIVKTVRNEPDYCTRQVFSYETPIPGVGHFISTYATDGDPLPAFEGAPQMLETAGALDEIAESYWELLNTENRVSLLARFVHADSGQVRQRIINKHTD